MSRSDASTAFREQKCVSSRTWCFPESLLAHTAAARATPTRFRSRIVVISPMSLGLTNR